MDITVCVFFNDIENVRSDTFKNSDKSKKVLSMY